MPERLTPERRKRVIDLWMAGLRFQQISSKTGVSLGSISKIVGEERAEVPDIQELRELGLSLKEAGISLEEAEEAAALIQSINRLGIPLPRLSEAVAFYEQHDQKPEELISLGKRLDSLTKLYGRSPEEIVARKPNEKNH